MEKRKGREEKGSNKVALPNYFIIWKANNHTIEAEDDNFAGVW